MNQKSDNYNSAEGANSVVKLKSNPTNLQEWRESWTRMVRIEYPYMVKIFTERQRVTVELPEDPSSDQQKSKVFMIKWETLYKQRVSDIKRNEEASQKLVGRMIASFEDQTVAALKAREEGTYDQLINSFDLLGLYRFVDNTFAASIAPGASS